MRYFDDIIKTFRYFCQFQTSKILMWVPCQVYRGVHVWEHLLCFTNCKMKNKLHQSLPIYVVSVCFFTDWQLSFLREFNNMSQTCFPALLFLPPFNFSFDESGKYLLELRFVLVCLIWAQSLCQSERKIFCQWQQKISHVRPHYKCFAYYEQIIQQFNAFLAVESCPNGSFPKRDYTKALPWAVFGSKLISDVQK